LSEKEKEGTKGQRRKGIMPYPDCKGVDLKKGRSGFSGLKGLF
jgi:hypothetical protein